MVEHLPNKHKVLSSNPVLKEKKKKKTHTKQKVGM
jgi:hypothetical protein